MENKLYWIRGCKDNPEGVKKALENKGIDTRTLLKKMFENEGMILFGVPGEFAHYEFFPSPLFYDVILQIGIELKPFIMPEASPNNTLYWCRGCYEDPDAVIRALNSKNIEIDPIPYGSLRMRTQCFFGTPGHLAHGCSEDSPVFRNVLQPFGVEIQPIFEKEDN